MPSNKQKNNERAAKYQLAQEERALDHLHNELSLAAQLLVKPQAHAGPALGGQNTTIAAISDPTWRRGDVRGKWLELRQRLKASGVDAPLPLEPSLTIPKSFLATMMVSLPHLGEDVRKRGPPEYADFAKSVPQENPFTRAAAQDAEDSNASTHGRGTNQSNIMQYNKHCNQSNIMQYNKHYHAAPPPAAEQPTATAPAAAPAAAALPSSEAQQLALREQLVFMKAMFEQGLIPSREIYEDKVRQILDLE